MILSFFVENFQNETNASQAAKRKPTQTKQSFLSQSFLQQGFYLYKESAMFSAGI